LKIMIRPSRIASKEETAPLKRTWIESNQVLLQIIFNVIALYGASTIYIQIWRIMTGH
jgi:hypothetical protein